jgi:adenine phosphoribosyltransferase
MASAVHRLGALVRDVADFPKPGIVFKDITPLLADAGALGEVVDELARPHREAGITKVVGVEARGFILAAPVAVALGAGFVPVRKGGKLPADIHRQEYELEYGTDLLEIHRDALSASDRVLILDDVLATGGTAAATVELVGQSGATVAGLGFLLELGFLGGRSALPGRTITSLLTYG